jgi:hypothetical protein
VAEAAAVDVTAGVEVASLLLAGLGGGPAEQEPEPALAAAQAEEDGGRGELVVGVGGGGEDGGGAVGVRVSRPVMRRREAGGVWERVETASRSVEPVRVGVGNWRQRVQPSRSRTWIWYWGEVSAMARGGGGGRNPSLPHADIVEEKVQRGGKRDGVNFGYEAPWIGQG